MNLAVALYHSGKYREAREEVHIAQKLGVNVDPGFLAALRKKMPEPE